ncbi:MAG: hypothetical protein KDE24_18025, partial [Caldilinea sp.]|nr:hypothetical protein [Caldilinea sp.]
IVQAVVFGLPMLSVEMAGEPAGPAALPPAVTATTAVTSGPGAALALRVADLSVSPLLTPT